MGALSAEENFMNRFVGCLVLAVLAGIFTVAAPKTQAQVTVNIGVAPDCPYGYYSAPPYDCAPYGYYGPEWFVGGVFIGAGPWFHGPANFHGRVNNHFHPDHGYKGPMPHRGDKPDPSRHPEKVTHFKANETRDGRGHVVSGKH
jgi:hypothetical protein